MNGSIISPSVCIRTTDNFKTDRKTIKRQYNQLAQNHVTSKVTSRKSTLYCLSQIFHKKGVLKNFLRPATLLKKGLWHWCFYVNFGKFLTTLIRKNCVLLNSAQKFIEIEVLVLLSFLSCLHNQLSSVHSIVIY